MCRDLRLLRLGRLPCRARCLDDDGDQVVTSSPSRSLDAERHGAAAIDCESRWPVEKPNVRTGQTCASISAALFLNHGKILLVCRGTGRECWVNSAKIFSYPPGLLPAYRPTPGWTGSSTFRVPRQIGNRSPFSVAILTSSSPRFLHAAYRPGAVETTDEWRASPTVIRFESDDSSFFWRFSLSNCARLYGVPDATATARTSSNPVCSSPAEAGRRQENSFCSSGETSR